MRFGRVEVRKNRTPPSHLPPGDNGGWLVIRNHRVLAILPTYRRAIRHAQHVAKYGESTW